MGDKNLLGGKRVLIVDDEPDVLAVLEELLSMCRVQKASTFQEAQSLLESRSFDIAILDIMGVDGYALLEIANRKNVTAVILTAHALTPDNLVKSIKGGAASYIPKDEIKRIADFIHDILKAQREGRSPWEPWQEKLPSSYFEKKFGAAWQDADKQFWEQFRESLRYRKSQTRTKD